MKRIREIIIFSFVFIAGILFAQKALALCVCDVYDAGETTKNAVIEELKDADQKGCEKEQGLADKFLSNCRFYEEQSGSKKQGSDSSSATTDNVTDVTIQTTDVRCFTKGQCEWKRMDKWGVSAEDSTAGFYQGTDTVKACGGYKDASGNDVGFCSAAGEATTEISFGGRNTFKHFGEFIQFIYKYAVWAAGILAVLMIMIAGFQWATSGGSPEKITSAKKRIGGAMMGLFLAVMSFVILNTINPYLVNLRLPQVWMVKGERLKQELEFFCRMDDDGGTKTKCENMGRHCVPFSMITGKGWEGGGNCNTFMRVFAMAVGVAVGSIGGELWAGPKVASPVEGSVGWVSTLLKGGKAVIGKVVLPAKGAGKGAIVLKYLKIGSVPLVLGADQYYTDGLIRKLAIGATVGGVEIAASSIWGEIKDFFKGNQAGVCLPSPMGLQKGDMCNPDIKNDKQCANGKCVLVRNSAVTKCITGSNTGFCSDGLKNAHCLENGDCKEGEGFKCAMYYEPLGMKGCSDGSEEMACDGEHKCKSDLECWKNRCTQVIFADVPENGLCKDNTNCEKGLGCWTIVDCEKVSNIRPGETVQVTGGVKGAKGFCKKNIPQPTWGDLKDKFEVFNMISLENTTQNECW